MAGEVSDMSNNYSIGVEEEYMLCDNAGDLSNKANLLMDVLPKKLLDRYSYELILSEFESNTSVHTDVNECMSEVSLLRNTINDIALKNNFRIGISGTHPTAKTNNQKFVVNNSYNWVSDQLKYYATKNITFSIHVHIGLDDKDKLIKVTNTLRRWIAPMLALSTNSPFFEGENTGMLSSRTFQFGLFPRSEIPTFIKSYNDYEDLINKYIETKTISKPRQIWWKIRPHYDYNTIEFRVCDVQRSFEKTEMIIALVQALVRTIVENRDYDHDYCYEYLTDALWKASSKDFSCAIIDPYDNKLTSMKDMIYKMISYSENSLNYFGNQHVLKSVKDIVDNGTEANEQIALYNESGFNKLKKYLMNSVDYQYKRRNNV
ncbi:MAG: hypothetical protein CMG50_04695 [Candidatus Marinimicrobia bacterium]|nr:hypothetical protein [Candidatus Neomarinimicrobiota bacterium]|tara:strand:+ start:4442 stop:5566 length:1125 start_codon:yes stop_codon:yes gene_type:complete